MECCAKQARPRALHVGALLALTLSGACSARVAGGGPDVPSGSGGSATGTETDGGQPAGAGGASALSFGPTGLHRLSRLEYDNTLNDLLGDTSRAGFAALPEDVRDPFDNDYASQVVSGALIAAAETLATEASARLLSNPSKRDAVVGCTPTGPGDRVCLESFVRAFGRRAFRRPLTDEEVTGFLGLSTFAVEAKDFYKGVDLVLRAMLQDPSFLYRVETGQPVAGATGLYRLNDYEIATRLSFFLSGTTPTNALLDSAAAGQLASPEGRRAAATQLLSQARGKERVQAFHAFWLGYQQLPFAANLATPMRAESDALVSRVVFEKAGDYFDLFRATETFVTPALATHYGLTGAAPPSAGGWVPYGSSPRRGILSHGTVLAAGAKFDDTSPTLRGVFIRNRLLCQVIQPPPPSVAVDQPPAATASSSCKVDRYAAHRSGGCAACHNLTDSIGFGLENYDRTGAFRATDKDNAQCKISGNGTIDGVGDFNGPAALGTLLVSAGGLESCVVKQLYRMALGRRETTADATTLTQLTDGFTRNGRAFQTLLLEVAAAPAFVHRQIEP